MHHIQRHRILQTCQLWASLNSLDEDETCRTFILHEEDHTLGNSLRYMVMKNPQVEFCGYSIPHPSESKINFRIQTKGPPAVTVLEKGLDDLTDVCQHVLGAFQLSVEKFKKNQSEESMDTS